MGDTNTNNMDVTTSAEGIESEGNKGPTVEELMKELAAEKAMNKKYKYMSLHTCLTKSFTPEQL